jgi:hypothetical protein
VLENSPLPFGQAIAYVFGALSRDIVMAGLVPAIHVFLPRGTKDVECPAQGRA